MANGSNHFEVNEEEKVGWPNLLLMEASLAESRSEGWVLCLVQERGPVWLPYDRIYHAAVQAHEGNSNMILSVYLA